MSTRRKIAKQRARQAEAAGLRTGSALPTGDTIDGYWNAIRFACGHALEIGVDVNQHPTDFRERLNLFLDTASAFPCPRCGSATGKAHDKPVSSTPTYLVANDVWYRACRPEHQEEATKNAEVARKNRGE